MRNGEPAPPKADPIPMPHLLCEKCDDFFLLRDGLAGIFLAASQFPKHRETRAPLVEDVVAVKDQLDPKFEYLTRAPSVDPNGNKARVRFQRKTREQYVMTEVDGKATGWRAFYQDGKWIEQIPEKRAPKKKTKTTAKKKTKKKTARKKAARSAKPSSKATAGRKKAPSTAKAGVGSKRSAAQ